MTRILQRVSFLLTGLVPWSAGAVDWRLEADWEAERQETVTAPLALVDSHPFQWREQYDLSVAQSGAQLDVRFEPQSETDWTVRQAFYDGSLDDYELTLGRKSLHWDYGYLANPLNWLGPEDGRTETRAEPLVSIQRFRGINTDQVVCSLHLDDDTEVCAVRTQGFAGALDWQALLGYDDGWQFGAGASWVPGLRWEYHGSVVAYESAPRWRYRHNALPKDQGPAVNVLVGTQVSGSAGWQLWLEHHYDSRAFSRNDWQRLSDDLDAWQNTPQVESLAPAWQAPTLSAHRSMVRLTQTWSDWDLTGTLIGFWADEVTLLSDLELAYGWTQQAEWRLGWQSTSSSGILARIGQGHEVRFGFNWILAQ